MPRYETGEQFDLWGVARTLRFLPDKNRSFSIRAENVVLAMPGTSTPLMRARYVKGQLKLRLHRAIAMRMPYWENKMGLRAGSITVREMKSRWGSCNTVTARLTFNLDLIRLDPLFLDYIIVHELAHLRHRRHNKPFWNLVGKYIPDWKRIRKDLNRLGEELSRT